jgi:hypothetical protein
MKQCIGKINNSQVCGICGAIEFFLGPCEEPLPREHCDCGGPLRSIVYGLNPAKLSDTDIQMVRGNLNDFRLPIGQHKRTNQPGFAKKCSEG